MESGPFSKQDFAQFARKVIPFAHITTRIPGKPHDKLLKTVGGRGFPTLRFLAADGAVMAEPEGRSVEAFEATLAKIETFYDAKKRLQNGDESARYDYLIGGIALGRIEREEAEEQAAKLTDLGKREQKTVVAALAGLELDELLARKEKDGTAIGDSLLAMHATGRIPADHKGMVFYAELMEHAAQQGDRKLYGKILREAQKVYGKERSYRDWFKKAEKRKF